MSVIVSVFYPLWYRSYRSRIKEILNNSDTNTAKSLLDSAITEHDTMANNDPDENSILHHAKDHLDAFQNTTQDHQKDATINALDAQ